MTIDGEKATLTVNKKATMPMKKVDGKWLIVKDPKLASPELREQDRKAYEASTRPAALRLEALKKIVHEEWVAKVKAHMYADGAAAIAAFEKREEDAKSRLEAEVKAGKIEK